MVAGIVEHRFVQIYQANEKAAASNSDTLWSTISQLSTVAASHCCEKVYNKVTDNQSNQQNKELLQIIQHLQNLILTGTDESKTTLFLHTITRLLIFNQHLPKKTRLNFHYAKDDYQINPFTIIIRQKPSLYFEVLNQVDYIFQKERADAIAILNSFFEALFLTENAADTSALLTRLMHLCMTLGTEDKFIVPAIYRTLLAIFFNYPLERNSSDYLALVDFLRWITIDITPFSQMKFDRSTLQGSKDYLLPFIDRLLHTASVDQPITPYLRRLCKMLDEHESQALKDVLWITLSYLLLRGQTLEEQQLITTMMQSIASQSKNMLVLRIAYIPLYQLISELNDNDLPKELRALKEDSLDMLTYLHGEQLKPCDDQSSLTELQSLVKDRRTHGLLAHFLVYLNNLYNKNVPILEETYSDGPDLNLTLNLLFSTPFIYDEDEDVRYITYSRITEVSRLTETLYKFPMLLFLLHMLGSSSSATGNARLTTHIFRDVLPTLADPNDPVITSKVLQVILSSISSNPNSVMASLGVKALAHMHQIQPRVWQELKRVIAEWVLRRKSGNVHRKIDMSIQGPIKMELAILTTMRDVCKDRPRECAADVLPMAISLLQTCQDLSMASLSILMATINHCTKAGLVEPRSIWNIAVVYLAQFSMEQGTQRTALLLREVCEFLAIAGAHHDISEPYLQFKESLLNNFIAPLISSGDRNAANLAMEALSKFSAQDIKTILPEKAVDYVQEAVADVDCPVESQHLVLSTLISHEIEHMRRGLFKEENASNSKQQQLRQQAELEKRKKVVMNDAGQVIGEREFELDSLLSQLWDNTKVAPGLRSGYAIAMLYTSEFKPSKEPKDSLEAISKLKWYRVMVTSFTDVSLTDHLLLRLSSVGSWIAFFKNALADVKNDIETVVTILLDDLLKRSERNTVPGVTCNVMLAITGLIHMVRAYSVSFAATCATNVIEVLMKNYIVLSSSPLSYSAHLMSEEVQFAARMALGYLSVTIIGNDKLMRSVNNVLIDSAVAPETKHRNIDTAIDLVQFANGFAAGHFIGALSSYPTKTDLTNEMKNNGSAKLLEYCDKPMASDSRVIGILMGLASTINPDDMEQELAFAFKSLETYMNGGRYRKGVVFGSSWLAAVAADHDAAVEYMLYSNSVSASTECELNQHYYHFVVPYMQVLLRKYLISDKDNEQAEHTYSQAFVSLIESIETDDASSHYRIASLFGLAALLGVDYLSLLGKDIALKAQRYGPKERQAALGKLAIVAGLTGKTSNVGNLKSGRIAAAVVGKVIETTKLMTQALETREEQGIDALGTGASSLITSSSEPNNYSRLSNNTSYLRGVFDQLNKFVSATTSPTNNSTESKIKMLLQSLISAKGPLPSVNWYNLLISLMKISSDIQRLCFELATTHAATSFSLSEFIFTQMIGILKYITISGEKAEFLFSGPAFATLLELGKLPSKSVTREEIQRRGLSSIVKKITLSKSRVLELIEVVTQKFQYMSESAKVEILDTLIDHLPDLSSSFGDKNDEVLELASSIREQLFESIMIPLLTEPQAPAILVQKAAQCSVSDISQVWPASSRVRDFPSEQLPNRMIAISEFYLMAKKDQRPSLTEYIDRVIGCSISGIEDQGQQEFSSIAPWQILAQLIYTECSSSPVEEVLVWLVRILDAFIVYTSSAKTIENFDGAQACESLVHGLRVILVMLRSCPCEATIGDIQFMDTVYLMDYYVRIAHDYVSKQEQIVKRISKIMEMGRAFQADQPLHLQFFNKIILGLPEKYLDSVLINVLQNAEDDDTYCI